MTVGFALPDTSMTRSGNRSMRAGLKAALRSLESHDTGRADINLKRFSFCDDPRWRREDVQSA